MCAGVILEVAWIKGRGWGWNNQDDLTQSFGNLAGMAGTAGVWKSLVLLICFL